ncbi:glycosyltransferase [Mesorhizobium sp. INR15]|uniref:glycosyltransferase n=1 Tax=Mesorhizobium sp. INR15 TaxID=2654248 RepID=UPI0018968137|nr:glycosyltransferase [Mesorhizobium sp. INR15]QPC90050.1 glycosyltransferase [Mesorhizobium sp. INR15]
MTEEILNSAAGKPDTAATRAPMISIDATGLLSWGGDQAVAGIQRVESFIIKAALAETDPRVGVVAVNLSNHRFRPLFPYEQAQLAANDIAPSRIERGTAMMAALPRALQLVRQYPIAKREADRQLARMVTNGRTGFGFKSAALLLRAYRLYRRAWVRLGASRQMPTPEPTELEQSTVLISHQMLAGDNRSSVSGEINRIAFLCHDLIPVVRPDLVDQGKLEKAFGANVESLVRSGATAFCASETASGMLIDHMRLAGINPPVVHRFPMPSILHETAVRLGMTSRIETSEPFVLYCSTINVRKNHILLARIWQQALDEGVTLPKLVCAGRWGGMMDPLRAYLDAHPELAKSLTFTGPINDEELIRYYRSASFGVFPSHIEGWGYAASECLDFGIPVIVSTTPALIEASRGLMPTIDSEDQAGWYAAIRKMADDTAWRSSLVDRIAQHHRPTPAAASWAAIKAGLQASASRQR